MIEARHSNHQAYVARIRGVCSLCDLVVPLEDRGQPIGHYPDRDELAYIPGGYCRGAGSLAKPLPVELEMALALREPWRAWARRIRVSEAWFS